MGAKDLNSGPPACAANTGLTESSPQLLLKGELTTIAKLGSTNEEVSDLPRPALGHWSAQLRSLGQGGSA